MSLPESDPKLDQQKPNRPNTAVSQPNPYTYSYYADPKPTGLQAYEPLPYQVERAQKNKRSTRWHYFPIAVAGILAILFSLFLLYQAIRPSTEYTRAIISGMADFTLIMFMLPLILLFIVVQLGMFGLGFYIYQWKREMPDSPIKEYGYIRVILWNIEFYLEKGRPYVERASDKASAVAISFNEKLATIESWLNTIKKWVTRS